MPRGKVLLGDSDGLLVQIVEWESGNEREQVFVPACSVRLLALYDDVDDWQDACDAVLKRVKPQAQGQVELKR